MSKGILEFTLPEEQDEFNTAVHASEYRAIIEDILNKTRNDLKHGSLTKATQDYLDKMRDEIYESLSGIPH